MNEAEYKEHMNGTFGECLYFLLFTVGARAPDSREKPGITWTKQEFADATGVTDRTVRAWLSDDKVPISLQAIEKALFDPKQQNDWSKLALRHAHQLASQNRTRRPARKLGLHSHSTEAIVRNVQDARMPTTSGDRLFGRQAEVELLNNAWHDRKINILAFIAEGGAGKTALINHWLDSMQRDDWCGAENVYTWSFYSQGMKEDRQASADPFFDHALQWFGYIGEPITSNWERGLKLAELVASKRTLLILDGLEPLQFPPGKMQGHLRDQGLQALLRQLSRINPGLCVITSRIEVAELAAKKRDAVISLELKKLEIDDGRALLRHLGVTGNDGELNAAVRDFNGHALALCLLGSYLATVHGGDILNRFKEPNLHQEVPGLGGHAERVMASYERWLKEHNTAELAILYMMGLFDRPVPASAMDTLRKEPPIPGLTDLLADIVQSKWRFALQHLRELHLLNPADNSNAGNVDAHPLVREYFGRKLRTLQPKAWQSAHERLYEYFKALPRKELPETIAEMEPLTTAIAHGCKAGKLQETFDDVYWPRIKRKDLHYNLHDLGMFGDDLAVLHNYFDHPWTRISPSLRSYNQAEVANWAGYCLQALGRLQDSAPLMKLSYVLFSREKKEWEAALVAGVLSGIYLALGSTDQAHRSALKAMKHFNAASKQADRLDRNYSPATFPTILAEVLHQSGDLAKAQTNFQAALSIASEHKPASPLHTLAGFRYWEFCLSKGQTTIALREAKKVLRDSETLRLSMLGRALCHLTVGNALSRESQTASVRNNHALNYLNKACSLLRKAAVFDHLPRGYLVRSKLLAYLGRYEDAHNDLCDAFDIANRGKMLLHTTDCHLVSARLALAIGKLNGKIVLSEAGNNVPSTAEDHIRVAADLIEKTGYGRRRPDLALVKARLSIVMGDWAEAKEHLNVVAQYLNAGWKIHRDEFGELTRMVNHRNR